MRRSIVLSGVATLAAMVVAVLLVHGTGEDGMRAAIRATARTSAICVALAFVRVRVREFSALLPISHAMHYVLIFAAGLMRGIPEWIVGIAAFAVMLWNAVKPNTIAIYILWIVFLIAFVRPGALYVGIVIALLSCGVIRWFPRTRATITS
ncbi:MAG TPA: hypothetical protein VNI54_18230 [Thermoanaerobaculia bacterium]|nr:hypothetical protein [Thermoanaerobaculia bacterium]